MRWFTLMWFYCFIYCFSSQNECMKVESFSHHTYNVLCAVVKNEGCNRHIRENHPTSQLICENCDTDITLNVYVGKKMFKTSSWNEILWSMKRSCLSCHWFLITTRIIYITSEVHFPPCVAATTRRHSLDKNNKKRNGVVVCMLVWCNELNPCMRLIQ